MPSTADTEPANLPEPFRSSLAGPGRAAFRADIVALAKDTNRATDGTFLADWEYRVISGVKTS